MLRPSRRASPARCVLFGRSVAVAVLLGYAVALGGTSSGYGLRLAVHLLAEHHDAHGDRDDAHSQGDMQDDHDEAHHHNAVHGDHGGAAEDIHSHHGRLHAHREAPPAPALLSIELDKHCVFAGPHNAAPGDARQLDWPDRAATPAPVVLAVEVRPPQHAA